MRSARRPRRVSSPSPGRRRDRAPFLSRRVVLQGLLSSAAVVACTRSERLTSAPSATIGSSPTTAAPTSTTASTTVPPTTSTSSTTTSITSSTTTSTTSTTTEPPPPTTRPDPSAPPPGAYDREALYVALYGHPGSSILGVLGEQGPSAGADRALEVAVPYAEFGRRVVPTFEIIASVAAAAGGSDGDYSNEFSFATFEPHLIAAAANGMHVVCDLQTGRSRFPDQAREYEALWLQPHVSIALDPEWRVGPDQTPGGGTIGTVDAAEVNETIDYIDALIAANGLPPKMCIVHQFTPPMITDKEQIRGTDHVQVVIQMDGFGSLDDKRGSWARTVTDLPDGAFTGWKNFYDEDRPTPTPAETMANEPQPRFVSYQ